MGVWYNDGAVPEQNSIRGCIYFSGEDSAWYELASLNNLGQNIGGANISLELDYRIASSSPDIGSLIPNNTWVSTTDPSLGLETIVVDRYWVTATITPWSVNEHDPNKKNKLTNYPNPFNGLTVVTITSSNQIDELDFSVYNSTGELIDHQIKKQVWGLDQLTFDGSKLPSGIYPYQVSSQNFSAWGKFVIQQ